MKKRLFCVALCYASTIVLLQRFFPEYWGRLTLAVLALDLGVCYVRSLIWRKQAAAAMAAQALEDEMGFDDETF